MTRRMASKGYDMIGVDVSEEMLSHAVQRSEGTEDNILYLCQDMRNLSCMELWLLSFVFMTQ